MFDIMEKDMTRFVNDESNKGLTSEMARFLVSDENLIIRNQPIELEIA